MDVSVWCSKCGGLYEEAECVAERDRLFPSAPRLCIGCDPRATRRPPVGITAKGERALIVIATRNLKSR